MFGFLQKRKKRDDAPSQGVPHDGPVDMGQHTPPPTPQDIPPDDPLGGFVNPEIVQETQPPPQGPKPQRSTWCRDNDELANFAYEMAMEGAASDLPDDKLDRLPSPTLLRIVTNILDVNGATAEFGVDEELSPGQKLGAFAAVAIGYGVWGAIVAKKIKSEMTPIQIQKGTDDARNRKRAAMNRLKEELDDGTETVG